MSSDLARRRLTWFEALHVNTTPLIGRDEEIDLLMRRWEQAKRSDGCVVLISGEPPQGPSFVLFADIAWSHWAFPLP
jgi:hypothetical protein